MCIAGYLLKSLALKATPIPCLYALAGIAPPHIRRRKVAANADRCLQEDDPRHPLHGQRPAKHRLTSRNSFLDSTEALNTSKQDARTTLWVEEWNALGERSTEWRDRGIIPNEHLAGGTDEPWSTWRSLNRLRVQKGRCRAMMKMWKLSHTDVCDCGERQTMSHLMTCGDAPNCTWTDLALPVSTVPNTGRNQSDSRYRGLDEEEFHQTDKLTCSAISVVKSANNTLDMLANHATMLIMSLDRVVFLSRLVCGTLQNRLVSAVG